MGHTRCYRDGTLSAEGFPVERVSDYLADPANIVWFDLPGPDSTELDVIGRELSLHDLAVEDARHSGQRPKVDHYPEHLFVVAYSIVADPDTKQLRGHEVNAFVTKNALVTVRADEGFDIGEVMARWDSSTNLADNGVSFLLYGLLDYIVDTHYVAAELMDNEVEGLEDLLFDESMTDIPLQRRTFDLRRDLVRMRKLVLPMREVVNTLMRRDLDIVPTSMTPYFQDVYDHVLRVTDGTESTRDLLANIMETRLVLRGNRLNSIMKKVTSWAAIIAVPTAITGFYGQNLPYPGVQQMWGFWTSLALMVGASGGLYLLFKRKDWL
jgi:magnesium transporter